MAFILYLLVPPELLLRPLTPTDIPAPLSGVRIRSLSCVDRRYRDLDRDLFLGSTFDDNPPPRVRGRGEGA
jgi:hypothetical protein